MSNLYLYWKLIKSHSTSILIQNVINHSGNFIQGQFFNLHFNFILNEILILVRPNFDPHFGASKFTLHYESIRNSRNDDILVISRMRPSLTNREQRGIRHRIFKRFAYTVCAQRRPKNAIPELVYLIFIYSVYIFASIPSSANLRARFYGGRIHASELNIT